MNIPSLPKPKPGAAVRRSARLLPAETVQWMPKGSQPRNTHGQLPGRNRREKRANAKAAQKAFIASKREQQPL